MKKALLPALTALVTLAPISAFAEYNEWKDGQFEVGGIYGRTDSKIGNLQSYGGYVAGGYYFGNHLLQLQISGLTTDALNEPLIPVTNPNKPTQSGFYDVTKRDAQEFPIWFRYSYGISFGPQDRIRFEAGPIIGFRVVSVDTKYNLYTVDTSTPTPTAQTYGNQRERDGGVTFDYGLSAALRVRIADHWALSLGYQYVRTTELEYKMEIGAFKTATSYVYLPGKYAEHGTHYGTLGVEYRF